MRAGISTALLMAVLTLGCASAYDQTYQREMDRLGEEQKARDAQERAAHSEARRYAAVVYFEVGSAVTDLEHGGTMTMAEMRCAR